MKMKMLISVCSTLIVFSIILHSNRSHKDLNRIENLLTKIKQNTVVKKKSTLYTITAYTPHKSETNNNPQLTATMEKPIPGGSCAVSRDLIHWLGGRIYIKGIGVRRVNDLMNARFEKRIDICVPKKEYAKKFGKKNNVVVVFLGK